MIVTEQFVFIHIHKTGGQFINKAILDHFPDAKCIGYHYPLSILPQQYAHLPVIAFVRNPWDWYVSWYMFNKSRPRVNPIYQVLSSDNASSFKDTIKRMVNLGNDTEGSAVCLLKLSRQLPDSIEGNRGSGITKQCIQSLRKCGVGYYSWLVKRMLGDQSSDQPILIGRYENLRKEFLEIASTLGVFIPDDMRRYLLYAAPLNRADRRPYHSYYDKQLKLLVHEKDSNLIDQYSYHF